MEKFIKTNDPETANKLIKQGAVVIGEQDGIFTFLNDGKLNFSEYKNIVFTSKLNI